MTSAAARKKESPAEKDKPKEETKPKEAEKKAVVVEDDDMFEDFPADDWEETEEDRKQIHQWEDTWEDEDEVEDFQKQLAAEVEKRNGVAPMKS
ncbi:hypothetical protein BJ742DRAFT_788182 [Cladochytrium replicatum]|nr:hypothetical protein BJ742DRAFT_788182 [Cladochytrium replicatum]